MIRYGAFFVLQPRQMHLLAFACLLDVLLRNPLFSVGRSSG
jgi:hypothetical protein